MQNLCVYCGSGPGRNPAYVACAKQLGKALAAHGINLVYGGGSTGIMGAVADAVLAGGGVVTGVMPQHLADRELAHAGLSHLHVVTTMHERKAHMAELADGFAALPGGIGTLEELSEILTWARLGLHAKPCGLLDVDGYYSSLIAFLDHMVAEQFLGTNDRRRLITASDPDDLLHRLISA